MYFFPVWLLSPRVGVLHVDYMNSSLLLILG